jgi:hypothetical protein
MRVRAGRRPLPAFRAAIASLTVGKPLILVDSPVVLPMTAGTTGPAAKWHTQCCRDHAFRDARAYARRRPIDPNALTGGGGDSGRVGPPPRAATFSRSPRLSRGHGRANERPRRPKGTKCRTPCPLASRRGQINVMSASWSQLARRPSGLCVGKTHVPACTQIA